MDEKDDMTPFPREPWQKLLADDGDGPPETTDARIRAAARRDLAPRGRRWWLPASLAASFVLAVFVVQSQLATVHVPLRESDGGRGGAITARLIEREKAEAPRPAGQAPAAAGTRRAKASASAESDEYGYPDADIAADSAGSGPRVGGPERELQAATEMPGNLDAYGAPAATDTAPPASAPAEPPQAAVAQASPREESAPVIAKAARDRRADAAEEPPATTRIRPPPFEKTPESWYAYIEKLRGEGRTDEAERQLARLEKAYPGWVERYLRDLPRQ